MFYEESELNAFFHCKKCSKRLNEPKTLPCGVTLCGYCTLNYMNTFSCEFCTDKHQVPPDGFRTNDLISNLLTLQPNKIYQGETIESFKTDLARLKRKTIDLMLKLENGCDYIKEYFLNLRNDVQLTTELTIQQIDKINQDLISQIDKYEQELIDRFKKNNSSRDVYLNLINETNGFYNNWMQNLKQSNLNDDKIVNANQQIDDLIKKTNKELNNVDRLIFENGKLVFQKNPIELNTRIIGELVNEFEMNRVYPSSEILTQKEFIHLLEMCRLERRWKLAYRASESGFTASAFHTRANNKRYNLVLIETKSGNVFGGYTMHDWCPSKLRKRDPTGLMFSVRNYKDKPMILTDENEDLTIFCHSSYGPSFKSAYHSFSLFNDSNECVNFFLSKPNKLFINEWLVAGDKNFTVKEIELYYQV